VPFLLESRELAADAMTYGCNKRRHDAAVEARGISRALVTRQHRPGLMLATVLSFVPPTACTTELPTPCPFHAPPTRHVVLCAHCFKLSLQSDTRMPPLSSYNRVRTLPLSIENQTCTLSLSLHKLTARPSPWLPRDHPFVCGAARPHLPRCLCL
jgi:hypothetical protein